MIVVYAGRRAQARRLSAEGVLVGALVLMADGLLLRASQPAQRRWRGLVSVSKVDERNMMPLLDR